MYGLGAVAALVKVVSGGHNVCLSGMSLDEMVFFPPS